MVLFDEPCSRARPHLHVRGGGDDPLKSRDSGICAIIVTHNMEQATRVSDRTAFFYMGDMVETGPDQADLLGAEGPAFVNDYLTGRFG